jgi:hypothetical protein
MRRELGVTDEAEHQGGDLLAVTNSNDSFFTPRGENKNKKNTKVLQPWSLCLNLQGTQVY